ncbi:hypothetical protein [Leisingera sp. S232]|uniref:hypothetical protein n=1 Tax=Leisingera sp. S232 TaxID=3415132 RepID=UPI003C7DC7E5
MIEALKRNPMISGVLLVVAIVGGLASFIEDIGTLWEKLTQDQIPVETPQPQSFVKKDLLRLSADVPVEWIVNRGHIENWLYVTPPNSNLETFDFGTAETGNGGFPYIFERYSRLNDAEYDEQLKLSNDLENQGLRDFEYISGMEEVFLGEGSWADRFRYRTSKYYIEKVSFIDYYHGTSEEPHHLELMCFVPISAEDRFKSTCARVVGSANIQD